MRTDVLSISSLLNLDSHCKRRRKLSDVDGPDTAPMSSKRRRLSVNLNTSRLSRPYSQPSMYCMGKAGGVGQEYRRLIAQSVAKNRDAALPSIFRRSFVNRIYARLGLRYGTRTRSEMDLYSPLSRPWYKAMTGIATLRNMLQESTSDATCRSSTKSYGEYHRASECFPQARGRLRWHTAREQREPRARKPPQDVDSVKARHAALSEILSGKDDDLPLPGISHVAEALLLGDGILVGESDAMHTICGS